MRLKSLSFGLAWLLLSSLAVHGQNAGKKGAAREAAPARPTEPTPRWPDGRVNLGSTPDHKGYWEIRPGLGGFRPAGVPFQPWAQALFQYRQKSMKDSPLVDCIPATGPAFLNAPGFEIVDVPELKEIFILDMAGPHSWRVIYMDGRQHPKGEDLKPTFLGHSIGHWESDTLVVDSVGFNEKQWPVGAFPTTNQLHLTERFTRPTLGSLHYEVTVDDPGAYTKPWSGQWTITEKTASKWNTGEMFEYICEDAQK